MAPEQRAGGAIDGRADLYACGVVLYELLTGEKPAGTDLPSDLNRSVPKSLDEVFRRSYARLERRYATAAELSAALGAAVPTRWSTGAATTAVPPPPAARPQPGPTAGCPRCHQPVDATDQFCMHCGVQLVAHVRRCRKCGAYPDGTDQYCIFCGETLKPELATA